MIAQNNMDISVIVRLCEMVICYAYVTTGLCLPVFHVIQPSIQQLLYKESVVRTQGNSSALKKWLNKQACCHTFRDLPGSARTFIPLMLSCFHLV